MLNAVYVMVSLVILEGLLSFDNALVLAAMVQPLPPNQQKLALRLGIIGAYLMRGLSIFFISYLIENPWLKPVGAAWLLYLAFKNLGSEGGDEDQVAPKPASFFWTVVAVEFADMAFSIDNIFAAAAFSSNIWAVLTGVAIGILAMRFVAGLFIELIKKFPVLEKIGYVLVGYIGVTLAVEYYLEGSISETVKFFGVVGIMIVGIVYERVAVLNACLSPVFGFAARLMGWIAMPVDWALAAVSSAVGVLSTVGKLFGLAAVAVAARCLWSVIKGDGFALAGVTFSPVALQEIAVGSLVVLLLAFTFMRKAEVN